MRSTKFLLFVAALALALTPPASAAPRDTTRVSVASDGSQGYGVPEFHGSRQPSLSSDGRYVSFVSDAIGLAANTDLPGYFVHDRLTGTTELMSTSSGERSGAWGAVYSGDISSDGRYVVFASSHGGHAPGDGSTRTHVFVRDRVLKTTTRITQTIDDDDLNGQAFIARISGDGRYVAYVSDADNLVPGDGNEHSDVFVHDRVTGVTEIVSVSTTGARANDDSYDVDLSHDGSIIALTSRATSLAPGGRRYEYDVFIRNRVARTTARITAGYYPGTVRLSSDGRWATFDALYGDARQIYVADTRSGDATIVSFPPGSDYSYDQSLFPSISGDGRLVAFTSASRGLAAGDHNRSFDTFVHDRERGTTRLVSVSSEGDPALAATGHIFFPDLGAALSYDGSTVAFTSDAATLVPGDTNMLADIFVHELGALCANGRDPRGPVSRRLERAAGDEPTRDLRCSTLAERGL